MRHNTRGLLPAFIIATVASCALTSCDRRAQRSTAQVAADLSYPDPADREWAADELSGRGPAAVSAVPALITALGNEREDDIRWRVARALGNVGDKAAVPSLIQALEDDCAMVRTEAAIALGKLGRKEAHDALAAHLDDATPHVRVHVAEALALLGDVDLGLPVLIEGLDELRYQVRYCAAYALADIGPQAAPAVPVLTRRLDDSEAKVRREVARVLGEIGAEAAPAIPQLAKLGDSKRDEEAEIARLAIARIKAAAAEAATPAQQGEGPGDGELASEVEQL